MFAPEEDTLKIAAVSYLNTVPFIYGIRSHDNGLRTELFLSPPAGCVESLRSAETDVGLIPTAEIPGIPDIRLFGSHCISATDVVRTVVLLSNSPLTEIHTIRLDPHSRISVQLVRVLAREKWRIAPQWEPLASFDQVAPRPGIGYTLIGDKVFGYESRFKYRYDLSHEWFQFTGLPFVFAAWVARTDVPERRLDALDEKLAYGVNRIAEAVDEDGRIDRGTAYQYLTQNIDFRLDDRKRESMVLFWGKLAVLSSLK